MDTLNEVKSFNGTLNIGNTMARGNHEQNTGTWQNILSSQDLVAFI
jgi:hypothetical protein